MNLPLLKINRQALEEFLRLECVESKIGELPDRDGFSVVLDSRRAQSDSIFFAVDGSERKGIEFVSNALEGGAKIIVADQVQLKQSGLIEKQKVSVSLQTASFMLVGIKNLECQLGDIARVLFNAKKPETFLCGVTGTNGKTTVVSLLAQAVHHLGLNAGSIGTLGYAKAGERSISFGLTTPDILSLHQLIRWFENEDTEFLAIEVSSHSIHQQRIAGLDFNSTVFTNLSQDHLDYHGDMENYAKVKASWILNAKNASAVINADDRYGQKIISQVRKKMPARKLLSYSVRGAKADINAEYIDATPTLKNGVMTFGSASINFDGDSISLNIPLPGEYNFSNLLAVCGVLLSYGFKLSKLKTILERLKPVEGRLEAVSEPDGDILVLVDFAHTPDALEKSLRTVKNFCRGDMITVFGCGGDRDKDKRPLMAKVGASLSDKAIFTSDNPRNEDPDAIINDMYEGLEDSLKKKVITILDREKAIEHALIHSKPSDCVVIAGKGHEKFQLVGKKKIPFSDQSLARALLARKKLDGFIGARS